jgi:hypothetical protein
LCDFLLAFPAIAAVTLRDFGQYGTASDEAESLRVLHEADHDPTNTFCKMMI